ncbi:lipase 3-like [Ctenocephalides felis]|uniref:lipase 3-like n=1 Tax=Ctenocephalides felis TaxID=7515 RepID=UPI000E6E3DF7|nr:lipase 3-like [Ctenocephalides felis]
MELDTESSAACQVANPSAIKCSSQNLDSNQEWKVATNKKRHQSESLSNNDTAKIKLKRKKTQSSRPPRIFIREVGDIKPLVQLFEDKAQKQYSLKLISSSQADFIQEFGYPVEQYNVTTKDGYILSLHRIPRSPKNGPLLKTFQNSDNKVVLLIPGLFSSSADFVLMGPNKSLALFLSDHGYDVWLGNNRGNKYSRMHQTLDPDSNLEYWDFSWHEMGTEDLPTIIDFVLNVTGQSKLDYIGHSQGTCVFIVMTSTKPEYNKKIRSMHALAPSIFMSHMKSNALNWANVLMDTVHATENNSREMLRYDGRISVSLRKFCIMSKFSTRMCYEIISDMIGRDEEQLDLIGIIPLIYHNSPAGSSTNQILHFWQNYNTGKFNMFDHGLEKNKVVYGQEKPPSYKLSNVLCKVYLYYGENDLMTGYEVLKQQEASNTNQVDMLLSQFLSEFKSMFQQMMQQNNMIMNMLTTLITKSNKND